MTLRVVRPLRKGYEYEVRTESSVYGLHGIWISSRNLSRWFLTDFTLEKLSRSQASGVRGRRPGAGLGLGLG